MDAKDYQYIVTDLEKDAVTISIRDWSGPAQDGNAWNELGDL